jgi:hypothetical protein
MAKVDAIEDERLREASALAVLGYEQGGEG